PPRSTLFPYTTLFRSLPSKWVVGHPAGLFRARQWLSSYRMSSASAKDISGHHSGSGRGLNPNACSYHAAADRRSSSHIGLPTSRSEEHTSELQSRSDL